MADETGTSTLTQKDQDLHDYQTKFHDLSEQILDLKRQNETKTSQIEQLQVELKESQQIPSVVQTQDEFVQRVSRTNDNLTRLMICFRRRP